MKTLFLCLTCLICFSLKSQNIGINTDQPTSSLHLKSLVENIVIISDDFEDNMLDPTFDGGCITSCDNDGDYRISNTQSVSGNLSLTLPEVTNGEHQIFNYKVNIPKGKVIKFSCYVYKGVSTGTFSIQGINQSTNLFTRNLVSLPFSDWNYIETTFFSEEFVSHFNFGFNAIFGLNQPVFVDDIKIQYQDGQALRIEDGTEMKGAFLASDELGNVTWSNDFEKFYRDSSSTNELQLLNLSGNILQLSQANSVSLSSIDDQHLSYDRNTATLSITNGNSINLNSIGHDSSKKLTVNSGGSVQWGNNTNATGSTATAWGNGSTASSGSATAFGYNSTASGFASTAWGLNTEANANYSTAFGANSLATGINSIAAGQNAQAKYFCSFAFGENVKANNENTFAAGLNSEANGFRSNAIGASCIAMGDYSTTIGIGTIARTYNEIALGRYNYDPLFGNSTAWEDDEMLFSIGNGTGNSLTERSNAFAVLKNGHVAIGKNNPDYLIDAYTEEDAQMKLTSNTGKTQVILDGDNGNNTVEWKIDGVFKSSIGWDATNERLFCYQDGNAWYVKNGRVGIKDPDPEFALELPNHSHWTVGEARSSGWSTYSDARVKKNVSLLSYGLKDLMKLEPKSYDHYSSDFEDGVLVLKDDFSQTVGLFAQEVYEIVPEAVFKPEDENTNLWTMDYEKLIPVLIKSIQEQQEMIDVLKMKIELLESATTADVSHDK